LEGGEALFLTYRGAAFFLWKMSFPIRPIEGPAVSSAPFLFIDASGRLPFVGILQTGSWRICRRSGEAAVTESLFALVEEALRGAGLRLADCAGFIFAEGPGSILGIRIAAMAFRAWRVLPEFADKPVFAVGSLALAAHLQVRTNPARHEFAVLADSRQGWWNTLTVRDGVVADGFQELRGADLAALPALRFHIAQRALGAPPVVCEPFPGDALERDPEVLLVPGLLRETEAPDAVNMPGQFVKWTPARHRAETAAS
jgi:tRNA threonylcarbamoyladenosine biosynthesis protein TsaB